jgi:hypothetical protein
MRTGHFSLDADPGSAEASIGGSTSIFDRR